MSYRLLGEGKLVFSGDDPPNCLSNAKWSALKIIYIQVTLSGLNRLYLCICAYKYTQKWGWWEELEEKDMGNNVIIF